MGRGMVGRISEQVTSIAELIKTRAIDWQHVYSIAHRFKCRGMLELGLLLAWKVNDAPIPEFARVGIDRNKAVIMAAQKVADSFLLPYGILPYNNFSSRFAPYHISIRDSLAEKIRFVIRLLFSPTIKEWMFFPIPVSLAFIHHILRPLRLIWSFLNMKRNTDGRGLHA
jgi:hypothetical protein